MSEVPPLRSLLFVPGDSERKQAKALDSGADGVILDLEDSVAPAQLDAARARVRELLLSAREGTSRGTTSRAAPQLWVRVNGLSSGQLLQDLTAVMPGAPAGLVIPKVSSTAQIVRIADYLSALEARDGRAEGSTQLIVIATESAQGVLALPGYRNEMAAEPAAAARLSALTWGSEDLAAALGASAKLDASGCATFTFQLARSLCLLACAALGIQAIDGICGDFRNALRLEREAGEARRDGFTGKLAIHPDQIATINAAFSPTGVELARARRIVAAFAANPQAGVLNLDGEMIDRPHLVQARRLLSIAARAQAPSSG